MTAASLTEFLLARIAEDETQATWGGAADMLAPSSEDGEAVVAAVLMRTRRAVADAYAKRQILELHRPLRQDPEWVALGQLPSCSECGGQRGQRRWPCDTLRALAVPYADHPDHNPEWRA